MSKQKHGAALHQAVGAASTRRKHVTLSAIALLAIVLIAVVAFWISQNQGKQNVIATHQRLNPQQYQTTMAATDHLLVDVRSPDEFKSGHIAGAVNIALQSLPAQINTLPKDKPIVVYCRSGARSNTAAQMLAQAGFTQIYDLGGVIDWRAQGLPLN